MINQCPHCKSGKGYIIDSRPAKSETGTEVIRRRRSCGKCRYRWSTYEINADEYIALRANNSQIAYKLIQQFKMQINEWLAKNNPNTKHDIDGVNRKRHKII